MKTRALLLAASLLLLPLLAHCSAPPPDDEEAISADLTKEPSLTFGTWKSTRCETVDAETFQLRTYRIAANGIFADWMRFASPSCSADSLLMTIRMGGSSKIDRASPRVPHTAEIRVFIDEKSIVAGSRAGVERLQRACPGPTWTTGVEIDVGKSGCGAIVPAHDACPVEYDLIHFSGTKLTFGDRARPLCSEATRPKTLSAWTVSLDHLL